MKNYCVYSVLTGNYDNLKQPLVVDERFDYILFSDVNHEEKRGVWTVRPIPYQDTDPTRRSRYPKLQPHKVLPEYQAWLYHDASIQIQDAALYERFMIMIKENVDWGYCAHPYRDCVYDEAYTVMGALDTEDNILKWCHYLRKKKFPRHIGLIENGLSFRRNNAMVKEIDDEWWNLYRSTTRRDQLTLRYIIWKNKEVHIERLLPTNESIWDTKLISITLHPKSQSKNRSVRETFWQHARSRCRAGLEEKKTSFQDFYYRLYKYPIWIEKSVLFFWGICMTALYGKEIKRRANERHKQQLQDA